jgi:hypothetical protein
MARSIFMEVTDPDISVGTHPAVTLNDGVTETIFHQLYIPLDFTVISAARVFIIAAGSGNMVASVATSWGKIYASELYNTHTDSIALAPYALTVNEVECIDISAALTGIAADDLVGIAFTRQGGHGSDTINAACYYIGLELVYN